MVPVLACHDASREVKRGESSGKVDAAERDPLAGAQVEEDDVADKGVGEDDEEEDAHEWDGTQQSANHGDGQVLHDTLCV